MGEELGVGCLEFWGGRDWELDICGVVVVVGEEQDRESGCIEDSRSSLGRNNCELLEMEGCGTTLLAETEKLEMMDCGAALLAGTEKLEMKDCGTALLVGTEELHIESLPRTFLRAGSYRHRKAAGLRMPLQDIGDSHTEADADHNLAILQDILNGCQYTTL